MGLRAGPRPVLSVGRRVRTPGYALLLLQRSPCRCQLPRCQLPASCPAAHPAAPLLPRLSSCCPACLAPLAVRTFCTVSRRPAGPHAPPPRRARLRSRCRSRYGGANAGRLARKRESHGPPSTTNVQQSPGSTAGSGVPAPAAEIVRGRAEPVKAVCDRRTTASVDLPGERTREDGLD